jgi:hypothetical protein
MLCSGLETHKYRAICFIRRSYWLAAGRTGHAPKDRRAAAFSKLLQLQYTEHGRESASCKPMKLNNLNENSRFPVCLRILRAEGLQPMRSPEFRIRVNGVYVPEICVQRENKDPKGDIQLVVKDENLGWFVVDETKTFTAGCRNSSSNTATRLRGDCSPTI